MTLLLSRIAAAHRAGAVTDPYWSSVISLLHFDGANGSTTITDQKGLTWTTSGNAQLSTSSPLFGTASLLLDGTGDYVTSSSNANFALGTGDFTIEWFAKQTAAKAISHIDFRGGVSSSPRLMVYNNSATPFTDLRLFVNGADRITAPTGTLIVGQRQHFAICRAAGTTRLFVDGVQVGSSWADSTSYTAADWIICHNPASGTSRDFNGLIDEFRATKGVGRYTSNFTPPSAPFPNS